MAVFNNLKYQYEIDLLEDKIVMQYSLIGHKNNQRLIKSTFKYILNPKFRPCFSNITLLAIVISSPSNFENRLIIRSTWASSRLYFNRMQTVFLIGYKADTYTNYKIKAENAIFKDIVQIDFVDSYQNLTLKTMIAMKWAATYCSNAKFVLKIDDDFVTNMPKLLSYLDRQNLNLKNTLFGYTLFNYPIDRNENSKFYVSKEDYGENYNPNFCLGGAYVFTIDLASSFFQLSKSVRFFPFEDVYLGFLMKQLNTSIVNITKHYEVNKWNQFRPNEMDYQSLNYYTDLFFFLVKDKFDMIKIWHLIQS